MITDAGNAIRSSGSSTKAHVDSMCKHLQAMFSLFCTWGATYRTTVNIFRVPTVTNPQAPILGKQSQDTPRKSFGNVGPLLSVGPITTSQKRWNPASVRPEKGQTPFHHGPSINHIPLSWNNVSPSQRYLVFGRSDASQFPLFVTLHSNTASPSYSHEREMRNFIWRRPSR